MAVAIKSQGALVTQASGTTLAVPIPALAANDYVQVILLVVAAGTVTPPVGWAEVTPVFSEPPVTPNLYYHCFWKRVSGSASATNENFTTPSGASGAKATTFTGAANSACTFVGVNNGTAAAYWQSPAIPAAGYYIANALVFAARTPSGAFTTNGTISSTNTLESHDTPTAAGFTGYRWDTAVYNVASVTPTANIRTTLSGGTATSDVLISAIPLDSGDVTDPTVAITSPSEGDTISGTITLAATLSDNVGVTSARAALEDATDLGSIVSGTLSVDTTLISNGAHTITVTAFDAAGNSGSDFVDVTVSNSVSSNGLSFYASGTETVLDDTQCRYWDGLNEIGFWYPKAGPVNTLSYFDGTTEHEFVFSSTPHTNPLSGLSYVAYGDSYGVAQVESGVDYTSSDLFPQHLAAHLSTTVTNRHVNSYMAMDVAYLMNLGSSGSKWVPGSFDFVTIHVGGNDMKLFNTAPGVACHKNGVEAMLSLLRMASRVNASSATKGGTWSAVSTGSSGNALSATNPGNTLTFSVSGPNATLYALANRDESGAAFTVSIDGGTAVAATTLAQATANPVVAGTYGLVPFQLLGMGAGSHTIVVTHAGTSGQVLVIDSIGVWDTDPDNVPYVLVVASQKAPSAILNIALPGPTYPNNTDFQNYKNRVHDSIARVGAPLGKISQVLADSYEKVYWANYLTSPTMFVSDGYHPNLKGMGMLHEVWEDNADRAFS